MATKNTPLLSRSHASFTPGDFGNRDARNALISQYPLVKNELSARRPIFRRDCLELEIRKGGKELTVFVCHFKSMSGGRTATIGARQAEALAVRHIIEEKYDDPASAHWMIVGDLNDYRHQVKVSKRVDATGSRIEAVKTLSDAEPSGIDPFVADDFAINLVDRRDPLDRWTHYYAADSMKTQLDYILASPALANQNQNEPKIVRFGTPYRVPNTKTLERYPRIGWDRPKASDHCPVVMKFLFE